MSDAATNGGTMASDETTGRAMGEGRRAEIEARARGIIQGCRWRRSYSGYFVDVERFVEEVLAALRASDDARRAAEAERDGLRERAERAEDLRAVLDQWERAFRGGADKILAMANETLDGRKALAKAAIPELLAEVRGMREAVGKLPKCWRIGDDGKMVRDVVLWPGDSVYVLVRQWDRTVSVLRSVVNGWEKLDGEWWLVCPDRGVRDTDAYAMPESAARAAAGGDGQRQAGTMEGP